MTMKGQWTYQTAGTCKMPLALRVSAGVISSACSAVTQNGPDQHTKRNWLDSGQTSEAVA
jgi:hypothetical protein